MKKYIIRRLLLSIPVLLGISMIIFALVHSTPGNPYMHMVDPNLTAEARQEMLAAIGFYDPLPVKYARWVQQLVRGNLGFSTRYREPVTTVMGRRVKNTLVLSSLAMSISILIGVSIGVVSATKQYSKLDYAATLFCFIGISIPAFFFGLLLIKFLAFDLGLFPIAGMRTAGAGFTGFQALVDRARHLVLPVTVLSLLGTASYMRYTRSSMLEVSKMDYIRTARAKGLSERVVVYKHALRNALIPVITVITANIPSLLAGAILTETIFVYPGVGHLYITSINNRDYPLIMGITMMLATATLMANLLADIMYAVVDPRIRYE